MQNLYPLFERNRILKKELLWSLRDYSFSHIQLEYQEYAPGILQGCEICVREDRLAVGPGIVKSGSFICLLAEEQEIPYTPGTQLQYLKMRVEADHTSPDYIAYNTILYIATTPPEQDTELELCRFHIREGAQLRDQYTEFADMETEYDTVNIIHASWGGLSRRTLPPSITRSFAETVLAGPDCRESDRAFAYLCLSQRGAVPAAVLDDYTANSTDVRPDTGDWNLDMFRKLCAIAADVGRGRQKMEMKDVGRRRIWVE